MKKLSSLYFLMIFFVLMFPKPLFAQQKNELNFNQFITIVNPLRISVYSSDAKGSLKSQYFQVQKRGLPATWLLNYDVILDSGVAEVVKSMDKSQELGLFLEITPIFAQEAGVNYNKTDSWHRANSVFLSGYTQEDRYKLIDRIFAKFKEIFGFYPTSVGAWWIDSYSLSYMKEKYNITANLTCADQFGTDGYQLWGQYWSTPFYPNKIHAGIPARSLDSKLDVVTTQWAARDPLNGYGKSKASLFSTQDYFEIDYFQKLIDLYAKRHANKYGQITVGLEGDFPPQSYNGFFASQLEVVKKESGNGTIKVVSMKDFSEWYRNNFPDLSPAHIIDSDDLLGKKIKSIWYQSPNFRINLTYNYDTQETKIRDFRTYHDNFQEPYYISPNRDLNLSINIPSQIDSASNLSEEWTIFTDELNKVEKSDEKVSLDYSNHKITIDKENIKIKGSIKNIANSIIKSPLIDVKKSANEIDLNPKKSWNFPSQGLVFRALTQEGTFFLKQKKVMLAELIILLLFCLIVFLVRRSELSLSYKLLIIGGITLLVIGGGFKWYHSNSRLYFVNQSELDALNRLRLMIGRKVVIYDQACLQCSWQTEHIPAVFANKRDYVKSITGKEIIYNSSIFNAKTRPEAKKELDNLNADYIYLVKFEDYMELAPFSPGDLNIEEIYSNANAQIWRVKKN